MTLNIQIGDTAAKTLRTVLLEQLRGKQEAIKAMQAECQELEHLLSQLNFTHIPFPQQHENTPITNLAQQFDYKENWTWEQKIKFIIEHKGRPLTTTEIVATLIQFEPKWGIDRAKAVASISSVLSTKSKEGGVFVKDYNERNEYIYDVSLL